MYKWKRENLKNEMIKQEENLKIELSELSTELEKREKCCFH